MRIETVIPYNRNDPEHFSRGPVTLMDRSRAVRGKFATIVAKASFLLQKAEQGH